MINYNNHNITGMSYNNHSIKYAYGCDGHLVWSGETPIISYKYVAKYSDGHSISSECTSETADTITSGEISGSSTLTDLYVGDCVCTIGECSFCNYTKLSGLTLPSDYLCEIGNNAFENTRIVNLTLPESVLYIRTGAFRANPALQSVTTKPSNLTNADRIFEDCTNLKTVNFLSETGLNNSDISTYAFKGCTSLKSIEIPHPFGYIKYGAFSGCTSLSSVTFSSAIREMESYAFKDCGSLKSITVSGQILKIGTGAFNGCSSLTKVTLVGTQTIGESAFKDCKKLQSVTIPSSITSIANYAFSGDSALTSVTIDKSTPPTLGTGALSGSYPIYIPCGSLTAYCNNSQWYAVSNRLKGKQPCTDPKWIAYYTSGSSVSVVTANCNSTSVINANEISVSYNSKPLTKLVIRDCVSSIASRAVSGYSSLDTLIISSGVTSIGQLAFYGDKNITKIYCFAITPPSIDSTVFEMQTDNLEIYVPQQSVDRYKTATNWSTYPSRIRPIP